MLLMQRKALKLIREILNLKRVIFFEKSDLTLAK